MMQITTYISGEAEKKYKRIAKSLSKELGYDVPVSNVIRAVLRLGVQNLSPKEIREDVKSHHIYQRHHKRGGV